MAIQSYALAPGHNNAAGLSVLEDFLYDRATKPLRFKLRSDPIPPGAVAEVTMDQKTHWTGTQVFSWTHRVLPLTGLSAVVTEYIGDFDTDSANVTVRSRKLDDTYANYNAVLALPTGVSYPAGVRRKCRVEFSNS